jgi:outer membrane protein OmpA-like peptidoglycan-associated protein
MRCTAAREVEMMRQAGILALRSGVAAAVAVLLAGPLQAAEDHPLVSRYPNSKIDQHSVKDFAAYKLAVGLATEKMTFKGQPVEGRLTRIVYTNPPNRSTLEIFRNYRQALTAAGAEILYECEVDGCGPAFARSAWGRFNGLFAASDGDPRYLAARLAKGDVQAYLALMVGRQRTQLDVVEVKAMDTGLVAVDPAALARDLEKSGSVRIYGIYFDVDESDIRAESKPALDAIAELLKAQPGLSIFVVGHTDSTGALPHNLQLSTARAGAVVAALTRDYGIAAARLDAHGVGPLAPVAPNTTDEGRQQNRRVELVAR